MNESKNQYTRTIIEYGKIPKTATNVVSSYMYIIKDLELEWEIAKGRCTLLFKKNKSIFPVVDEHSLIVRVCVYVRVIFDDCPQWNCQGRPE